MPYLHNLFIDSNVILMNKITVKRQIAPMKRLILPVLAGFFAVTAHAQKTTKTAPETGIARPKLVVGIVIDQMRWDYLYRFNPIFKATGGFKRLMGEGFSCDNNLIPYTPTITACGHTCAYTGSVPAIHGITGNAWWDNQLMKTIYCSEDKTVKGVGGKVKKTDK
jgi:predicted AlkP superfamily pyrophosphatase or phosphodiesterase